ncbi:Secreted lipase [Pseudocercospora fuligena]|uniref:Carboxylic ester hydrolase n=1 Tax=Pseudocercospora fuligena TaxID=685502 RepID=A0A8H6RBQ0_9PEZI|nr:Secreted lipase [Pseudocercospora fuligena]
MRSLNLGAFLCAFGCVAFGIADNVPTAKTNGVTYHGFHRDRVEAFLGIQYAEDTGGENRFRPPIPYEHPDGSIVQATKPGSACPQDEGLTLIPLYLGNYTDISEDCLRLNVFRPNGSKAGDKLPVMVYIHGGSFYGASKDDPNSQPAGLILNSVANRHPVIQVQLNYRLGVFGFAKSEALRKDGSENLALRDQRLALQWVHDHIESFGGDCKKVTLQGQSSGGFSVGMQTLAFGGSKPQLFQTIIGQSQILEGGITGNFTRGIMARIVKQTGCNKTSVDSDETISCLRNLSMTDLLAAQTATQSGEANIGDEWLPTVDGDFIPAAPSTLLASKRFYNVTTMLGWCEDDTTYFVYPPVSTSNETTAFFKQYLPNFTPSNLTHLLSMYPKSDFHNKNFPNGSLELPREMYRAGRILRDILMVCQPILFGSAMHAAGNDVYLYVLNQTILTPIFQTNFSLYGYGVEHTSDFAYVFGNLSNYDIYDFPFHPSKSDYALAKRMSTSWANFAALRRPSLKGWKKASFENDKNFGTYVIGGKYEGYSGIGGNEGSRKAVAFEKLRERCEFLTRRDIVKQIGF